jgi:hypothetical protein
VHHRFALFCRVLALNFLSIDRALYSRQSKYHRSNKIKMQKNITVQINYIYAKCFCLSCSFLRSEITSLDLFDLLSFSHPTPNAKANAYRFADLANAGLINAIILSTLQATEKLHFPV